MYDDNIVEKILTLRLYKKLVKRLILAINSGTNDLLPLVVSNTYSLIPIY
jgi:hypothetical protein